jgi:hypothetical protein
VDYISDCTKSQSNSMTFAVRGIPQHTFRELRFADLLFVTWRHRIPCFIEDGPQELDRRWIVCATSSVTNTRLAVRKCRGGPQGQEFHFSVRKVQDPDEDGDPVTTLVIEWTTGPTAPPPPKDPLQQCRRADQQTAVTRLKRVLMAMLAEHGVDRPISQNGPAVRMIDRQIVRTEFYAHTAADGTPAQKGEFRRKQFDRALEWTEQQKLIGIRELEDVTYLWLSNPRSEDNTHQPDDL